jgi:hypothetical protein
VIPLCGSRFLTQKWKYDSEGTVWVEWRTGS